jgi:hypothetical protein
VCKAGDHRLADGDRRPIDHDVRCALAEGDAVKHDGKLAHDFVLEVAQPLGAPTRTSTPFNVDEDNGWKPTTPTFAAGIDLPRCAEVTFRATISRFSEVDDTVVVWEQALHVRPRCSTVRFARAPVLACDATSGSCRITIERPPHDVALVPYARRTPPEDDPPGPAPRFDLVARDDGALEAVVPAPAGADPACAEVKVEVALVREGGVVWTGRTSYVPDCPRAKH